MLLKSEPTEDEILEYSFHPISFAVSGLIYIHDTIKKSWIPWHPWPQQLILLDYIFRYPRVVVPKARQLGVTTTVISGYSTWKMIFRPITKIGIFSLGERVAGEARDKLVGTYIRLPKSMRERVTKDNKKLGIFRIEAPDGTDEGSMIQSLPSTGGEGSTFDTLILDEAGRMPKYGELLGRVAPAVEDTIIHGDGKIIAMGIYDKNDPSIEYKNQIKNGMRSDSGWTLFFMGWKARPDRSQEWFNNKKKDMLETHGSDDERKQQYPETIDELLSAPEASRRLPSTILDPRYEEWAPLKEDFGIPGLRVYILPEHGVRYVATADCAEGLLQSDDSTTRVCRQDTGEVCAVLQGKLEPGMHADYSHKLCNIYNCCSMLFERNKDGIAFKQQWDLLNDQHIDMDGVEYVDLIDGYDGRPGWLQTKLSKPLMYHQFVSLLKRISDYYRGFVTWALMDLGESFDDELPVSDLEILYESRRGKSIKDFVADNIKVTRGDSEEPLYLTVWRPGKIFHDGETYGQLGTIDHRTLKAPGGYMDDLAVAAVLIAPALIYGQDKVSGKTI